MTLFTARQCTLRGENQCGFKMAPAYTAVAPTLFLLTQSVCVSTGFMCPDLSYLDSFVQLICTGGRLGVHTYTNPSGVDVARCILTEEKPACSITSKEDTDVLAQYQALTLTVDIQDFYCSTALNFSLQTGNVTALLMEADSVASVTHNTSSVTLNVTDSHLGVVGLIFSCHNKWSSLTCDGVRELTETLTCSISSDKDTDRLVLYELSLTLDIVGFNCSVASSFYEPGT